MVSEADYGLAADATTGGKLDISYAAPAGVTGTFDFTTGFDASFTPQNIAATGTAVTAFDIST
ncbi:flagellin, partial [Nitrosomonas sp. HPC101]|uniref:hypothetical protein n=1 Tax=Nitrosomonas sp. HPC101 TaxID=1658667 RepID=UPI001961E525